LGNPENRCEVGILLVDSASEDDTELAETAVESIFENHREDRIALSFASTLILKLSLAPNFESLLRKPMPFIAVQLLVNLSVANLAALLVLDESVESCLIVCWNELRRRVIPYSELCSCLISLYRLAASEFAIVLNSNWLSKAVKRFVRHTTMIPVCLVVIAQRKDFESDEGECDLLRLIAGHSKFLLQDAMQLMSNADLDFSRVVIRCIQQLVDADAPLFVSSLSDDILIEFVRFLLEIPGTPRLINSILVATQSQLFLSTIAIEVCEFVREHPRDTWARRMLVPLAKYVGNLLDLIKKIPESPALLASLLDVLELIPSSNEHYQAVDALCLKAIELLNAFPLAEPLLHDICILFKLVILRTETEVTEFRSSVKTSRIRRLLTTVEELSPNNCIAALTVGFIPDYPALYSAIAPKYLPIFLLRIIKDSRPFLELFVSAFEGIWRLFLYFAMATTEGLQQTQLIGALLQITPDNQILPFIKNLFEVLSYRDSFDRTCFCRFLEHFFMSYTIAFASEEFINLITSIFQQLRIPPFLVIKLICDYIRAYPSGPLISLQYPFTTALSEIKTSSDDLLKTISFICTLESSILLTLYSTKGISSFMRTFSLCDKTAVEYPRMISKFASIDDSYNWNDCVIPILFDGKLWGSPPEYLRELMNAVNVIAKKSERFIVQIFELLSSKTEAFWKRAEISGTKRIRLLAFVIFACEFDVFSNRQQNINQVLAQALTFENMEFPEFQAFSLFMRVLFIRVAVKTVESFSSIVVNELTYGLTAGNEEMKMEAERLMRAAMIAIPGIFQFSEFAFLPDLISFPGETELGECVWPLMKNSPDSLMHLSGNLFDVKSYESQLMGEFLSIEDG
jgi:hypothetical protein